MEQRASDLETQLSDALVDVQRRDATISELKAALQVDVVFVCVQNSSMGANNQPTFSCFVYLRF